MSAVLYVAIGAYVFGTLFWAVCVAVARAQQQPFKTPLFLAVTLTVFWPIVLAWTLLSAVWTGTLKELRARVSDEPEEGPVGGRSVAHGRTRGLRGEPVKVEQVPTALQAALDRAGHEHPYSDHQYRLGVVATESLLRIADVLERWEARGFK